MKTESTVAIPIFQNLGTGRYYYHFNHSSYQREEDKKVETINTADTVVMAGIPTVEKILQAMASKVTDKGDINPVQYDVAESVIQADIEKLDGKEGEDVYLNKIEKING